MANILQHEFLTDFVYPFLLIFFIVFAVLEKIKLFGDDNKQVNALTAFVIGMIFIGATSPKMIVNNLILFLAVAMVIVFVVMLIWGFLSGGEAKFEGKALKMIGLVIIILAVIILLFFVTGVFDTVIDTLFKSSWSEDLWTNVVFIVIIAVAVDGRSGPIRMWG